MLALVVSVMLGNIAASRPDPAAGAVHARETPVHVASEQLVIECRDDGRQPTCAFTAEYALENPTGTVQVVDLRFVGAHASEISFTLDGAPVADDGEHAQISVAETARLAVRGTLMPGRYFVASYAKSAVETRHPLLGSAVPRANAFDLTYALAPIRTWAGPPPKVALTLTHPPSWRVSANGQDTSDGRLEVELDAATVDDVMVRIETEPPRVFNAGPFIAAGGAFDHGFRFRAGYEIAAPDWLFISLAAETDFVSAFTLVPLVHAASDGVLTVFPSFSAGLGVPVDLAPIARVGGRLQLTIHWPFIGFVAALDVFPGTVKQVRVSLFGQVAL